ncbi:hypothetical protein [Burkholderia cenocepacia]|uniref:hypothetical protein n=1 Tax=Burkholderia cenocepacia TaxID=95486 RepID=UPI0012B586E7|nr:hypothetical protein [Burkholderia cenocepacia]
MSTISQDPQNEVTAPPLNWLSTIGEWSVSAAFTQTRTKIYIRAQHAQRDFQ